MVGEQNLVSIVVPIYNQEAYLNDSIADMKNQTYKNIEMVLVDDGSTDKSHEIIQEFSKSDDRIKIVKKKNGGLVDATITGIRQAGGEYIAFLDPDDRIGEDFIENLIKEMKPEYDFVAAGIHYNLGEKVVPMPLYADRIFTSSDMPWLRTHYLLGENSSLPQNITYHSRWNKLYRKKCIDKFIDKFEQYKDVTLGEDNVFTYLMMLNCTGGIALKKPNSYYYNMVNPNSMMNTDSINKYLDKVQDIYERYAKLMRDNGDSCEQAYMLFYMLSISFLNKCKKSSMDDFVYVYKRLRDNETYIKALKFLTAREKNLKRKLSIFLKRIISSPTLYLRCFPH